MTRAGLPLSRKEKEKIRIAARKSWDASRKQAGFPLKWNDEGTALRENPELLALKGGEISSVK